MEREPRLLERESELADLCSALERASDGAPSVTVVEGEAGIGKSRLVRELALTVQRENVVVLRGDCVEFEGVELPYGPVAAALRDVPPHIRVSARFGGESRARWWARRWPALAGLIAVQRSRSPGQAA